MRDGAWHCAAGGTRCSLPARYWTPEKNSLLWPVIKNIKNVLLPPDCPPSQGAVKKEGKQNRNVSYKQLFVAAAEILLDFFGYVFELPSPSPLVIRHVQRRN
jgi:hypothetical protein